MRRKLVHLILLTALVAASSLALAQDDPPARVGRISSAEGQVTVEADGEEAGGSLLNWPVASGSRITAAPGARAEFRIGSAAVRLDGDSSLDVEQLDDNSLRLRLNYGSASVRLRSGELLGGFELATPQARIAMLEPGALRVDAERQPDTSAVTVLAGAARVQGAGSELTVRAGKRALVQGDNVGTGLAQRDGFDDWVQARDKRDENSPSLRYVTADVTGYEELDQYGSWRDNPEYGPLWSPRSVPAGWAPYRDGRWTWLDPWGWTWVDDAPWGYAPSHYGRWVMLDTRWYWAPGRPASRPVWAPALVGWVGGSNWSVAFANRRSAPGVGWYPLTPRDRFVPNYRVSAEHERRLVWQHSGQARWKEQRDPRRDGVTVLPREQFDARHTVHTGKVPRVSLAPNDARNAPLGSAPQPAQLPSNRAVPGAVRPGRMIETRRGQDDGRDRQQGNGFIGRVPAQNPSTPYAQQPGARPGTPGAAMPVVRQQPGERGMQAAAGEQERRARQDDDERERRVRQERDSRDGQRWTRTGQPPQPTSQQPPPPTLPQTSQQTQPQPAAQQPAGPPPQAVQPSRPQEQPNRQRDDGRDQLRGQREEQQRVQREQAQREEREQRSQLERVQSEERIQREQRMQMEERAQRAQRERAQGEERQQREQRAQGEERQQREQRAQMEERAQRAQRERAQGEERQQREQRAQMDERAQREQREQRAQREAASRQQQAQPQAQPRQQPQPQQQDGGGRRQREKDEHRAQE